MKTADKQQGARVRMLLQKSMLNNNVDTLCHRHTHAVGFSAVLLPSELFKLGLFPAAASLSPRFQQYCTAPLMLNGSHALYNPGYTGKIRYRVSAEWAILDQTFSGNVQVSMKYLPGVSEKELTVLYLILKVVVLYSSGVRS